MDFIDLKCSVDKTSPVTTNDEAQNKGLDMKRQADTNMFDISPLMKKIEEIESDFEKKCLQYDLKQERLMVSFYKEFVKNMMRHELDHCWF